MRLPKDRSSCPPLGRTRRGGRRMKLPNADQAVVEQAKICEYLLNQAHRFGAGKARFFAEFGFTLDAWEVLAIALKGHGRDNEVTKMKDTAFGPRYEVEGELAAPNGRRPRVRMSPPRMPCERPRL